MAHPTQSCYVDCCPCCRIRTVVAPVMVTAADNGHGVTADYLCPSGHIWHTGWLDSTWRDTDETAV